MDEALSARLRAVLVPSVPEGESSYFLPDHCANCLVPLDEDRPSLYCSDWCATTSELIRYARATTSDGRFDADPLVRDAIQIRLAFAVIGGYPRAARRIPDTVRAEVTQRDGGICVQCGEPANQIDHIDGDETTPANLQLLCDPCHREKTRSSMVPADDVTAFMQRLMWALRVMPETPLLLVDDHTRWRHIHNGLRRERRARLADRVDLDETTPGSS